MPRRFVSPSSCTILGRSKSLESKVRFPTRDLFEIEAHNFALEGDLKNKGEDALLCEDVRTHCFLIADFVCATFLD